MTTHLPHLLEITVDPRLLRGTILPDLAVTTMTTGCVGLSQLDTTRGHTIQILTARPLTRRIGTILSLLIVTSTTAEDLPLRGTHLILPPAAVAVVLHRPAVEMTLTVLLPGKILLHSTMTSLNSSPGTTLPVLCPLDLTITLPPERTPLMDHLILAIGVLILLKL